MAFKNIDEIKDDHLHILWTTGSSETAANMVLLYATNALIYGWWKRITVIIWGEAQNLVFEDEAVRLQFEQAREAGVEMSACIGCARRMGRMEDFENIGVEIEPWGERISQIMHSNKKFLNV